MANIPDKPTLDGIEARWAAQWQADGTYDFDASASRERVFAIDTPPPTVSGSLHMGHVFSYTHTDIVARFQRMSGKAVFYPIGWDDNGLPTERRVQNYYGVRCDPTQQYVEGFEPPFRGDVTKDHRPVPVSRPNFIELCDELVEIDEQIFEAVLRRLGLSYDWSYLYATIDERSRRASQRAFLRNLHRGEAYLQEAPTLWDIDDRTAVAQAEMEDRERQGAYYKLLFHRTDGAGDVEIDTTRPELVAACVALVAHPDDERYQPLFGSTVRTPLYGVEVPILAHELAEPDKGTGIAMICTFGDTTDVTWWRELALEMRPIIGRDGRILPTPPPGVPAEPYAAIAGLSVAQAQKKVVEQLAASGEIGRRAAPDHARGEVLRARQPPAGDRHQPSVVHPQRRPRCRAPRGARETRRRGHVAPGPHAAPLRQLGRGAQRRLADQPPALLRRADPGVVPPRRRRRARLRRAAHPRRVAAADRPVHRCARTATPPNNAASPVASSVIPTCSTRGRRRR